MSDRDAFREAREHGLAKRHEQRLEHATYTAGEVKVLTEAALRLGRKEAGEEIAQALEEAAHGDYDAADDLHWAAEKALAIASLPSGAVSDERSGTTEPQEAES